MAFPNSGAVSLNAFADEVGDSDNIHSMSEFYRKSAGPVYDIGDNSDIPTSGAISFSQLRGTSGVAFRSTSQGVQDNPAGANTLAAYFNSADRTNKVCHLTVDTTIGANASISTGNFASGDPLYVDINSTNGAIHGAPGNAGNSGSVDTTNGAANNPNSGNQGGQMPALPLGHRHDATSHYINHEPFTIHYSRRRRACGCNCQFYQAL